MITFNETTGTDAMESELIDAMVAEYDSRDELGHDLLIAQAQDREVAF